MIIDRVEQIKKKALSTRNYRVVADKCGVTYHWLQKFAIGEIPNPTIENVAKLESYFFADDQDAA